MPYSSFSSQSSVLHLKNVDDGCKISAFYKPSLEQAIEREKPLKNMLMEYFTLSMKNNKEITIPPEERKGQMFAPRTRNIDNSEKINRIKEAILKNLADEDVNDVLYEALNEVIQNPADYSDNVKLTFAVIHLIEAYFNKEENITRQKATKYTCISMLLIVTIPFFYLIYSILFNHFAKQQTFQMRDRTEDSEGGLMSKLIESKSQGLTMNTFFDDHNRLRADDQAGSYLIELSL